MRPAGCCRHGLRRLLTVLSTDAVFTGPRIFHDEFSVSTASHSIALAARRIKRTVEEGGGLVVRTHAYGWGAIESEPSFAEKVWQALSEGRASLVDPHRSATPILATDLAELLDRAYQRGLRGLYHLAGAARQPVPICHGTGCRFWTDGLPLLDTGGPVEKPLPGRTTYSSRSASA